MTENSATSITKPTKDAFVCGFVAGFDASDWVVLSFPDVKETRAMRYEVALERAEKAIAIWTDALLRIQSHDEE